MTGDETRPIFSTMARCVEILTFSPEKFSAL